jgi:hypothetical protein
MPYSSEVRVASQVGTPLSGAVAIQLWEISTTFDNENRVRDQQVDQERVTVTVAGAVPSAFATMDGPSYSSRNNHDIALSAYESTLPGPIFRSARLASLPPGSPGVPSSLVDVMLLDAVRFTMIAINAMIPTPITLDDGNVVSTATISSAPPGRILTVVATGPYGRTTYTYTLPFTIDPSDDQIDLTRVLEANRAGTPTITFVAGPGGGFQAFLDSLFSGLFIGQITNRVLKTITDKLNASAATAAAAAVAAAGFTGGLPPGVILGVRSVVVVANGDLVMTPAIGTFGSIMNKFLATLPPTTPSSGGGCFIATAVLGPNATEIQLLRQFRSQHLLPNCVGRMFIRVYELVSPPFARLIDRSAPLRFVVRRLLIEPIAFLVQQYNRRNARTEDSDGEG